MNQKEFNEAFKRDVLPSIQAQFENDGIIDKPARREAYNNLMDSYHRDGLITNKQVQNWVIPANMESPRVITTEKVYVIQGYYNGWEDLTSSTEYKDAKTDLKAYRDNEKGAFRIISRREKIEK